jgi:hypothetical protein
VAVPPAMNSLPRVRVKPKIDQDNRPLFLHLKAD